MNYETVSAITALLYQEAYLLDHQRYTEWLDLLTDDIIYQMPVRITRDRRDGSSLVEAMTYFDETKGSLTERVHRLSARSAWVENPPPRVRHFISNIQIEPTANPREYFVRSYFRVERSRGSEPDVEHIFGEREDRVVETESGWKVASRQIFPDQASLTVKNLAMFL